MTESRVSLASGSAALAVRPFQYNCLQTEARIFMHEKAAVCRNVAFVLCMKIELFAEKYSFYARKCNVLQKSVVVMHELCFVAEAYRGLCMSMLLCADICVFYV